MPQPKDRLTSFDIALLARELDAEIRGFYIDNVYQPSPQTILLKLRRPGGDVRRLLIEEGRRAHLTKREVEVPQSPPPFCMALRKHLENGVVLGVEQAGFERIIQIRVRARGSEYRLIAELFNRGTIILADSNGTILQAMTYRRMKDRSVVRGEGYRLPPPSGLSPFELGLEHLLKLREGKGAVRQALRKLLAVGGAYVDEILAIAGVDGDAPCQSLDEGAALRILGAVRALLDRLGEPRPVVAFGEEGEPLDVAPFRLSAHEGLKLREYRSMNEAVDDYFSELEYRERLRQARERARAAISKEERVLREQEGRLRSLEEIAERERAVGDLICSRAYEIDELLSKLREIRERLGDWGAVEEEAKRLRDVGEYPFGIFAGIDGKSGVVKVELGGELVELELGKGAFENAAKHYAEHKKAAEKLRKLREAIEATKARIAKLKAEAAEEEAKVRPRALVREKAWYERFRHFSSSDGFLVVMGRDAASNEALIKRHAEPRDIVLHADIHGAPFALIKVGDASEVPESTIFEAAQFAASYSSAWREGLSAMDVYWVRPGQLSKAAPPGEYLGRGAFMVRGRRNYLRGVPLGIAICAKVEGGEARAFAKPAAAARASEGPFVEIVPGDRPSKELAAEVRRMLAEASPRELRESISRIKLEDISQLIPYGRGAVKISRGG